MYTHGCPSFSGLYRMNIVATSQWRGVTIEARTCQGLLWPCFQIIFIQLRQLVKDFGASVNERKLSQGQRIFIERTEGR